MDLDRGFRNAVFTRDFLVARATGDAAQDVSLSRRQGGEGLANSARRSVFDRCGRALSAGNGGAPIRGDKLAGHFRRDDAFAVHRPENGFGQGVAFRGF